MRLWSLEDVERRAQKYGDSFFIPSREVRTGLKPGSRVRLHFILAAPGPGEPRTERLWVKVGKVRIAEAGYEGSLVTQPVYIKELNAGDQIEFGAEHIAQTMLVQENGQWLPYSDKLALVSAMCFVPGEAFRCIYREKPECDEDSGWRIFTGHEQGEYTEECANIRLIEIGCLVAKDASLFEVFTGGSIGSGFERAQPGQPWLKIKG